MSSGAVNVTPRRTSDWDPLDRAALAAIVVIAAALCLYRLASRSIWYDEAAALGFARELGSNLRIPDGGNMAFYYLFLKAWLGLGDGEWIVRLPSVLFVAAGAGLLYLFAQRLFDRQVAIFAAILLVTNASLVRYGQEARGYAMELLLVVASWLVLAVALERRQTRWFVLYGLLAGLAVAVHMFAVFFLAAQVLSLFFLGQRQVPWNRVLIGIAVASLPVLSVFVAAVRRGAAQIAWIPPLSPRTLGHVFSFLVGMFLPLRHDQPKEALTVLLLVLSAAAWTAALVWAVRTLRQFGRSWETWSFAAALLWFTVPLLLCFGVSASFQSLMSARYFIALLPPSALLVGLALGRVRQSVLKYAALALLVSLNVVGLLWTYESGDSRWRDAVAYVMNETRAGDSVGFVPPYQRATFDYYLRRHNGRPPEELNPPSSSSVGRGDTPRRVWLLTTQVTRLEPTGRMRTTREVAELLRSLGPLRLVSFRDYPGVNVILVEVQGRSS